MLVFYLDTSAILKRYRTEEGTPIVDGHYDTSSRNLLLTSQFACLEFEAVASRALRISTAQACFTLQCKVYCSAEAGLTYD